MNVGVYFLYSVFLLFLPKNDQAERKVKVPELFR